MFDPGTSKRTLGAPKFKSDPRQSSFRWEIDLTDDGINRVPMIEGYSKGQGFECTNKGELLIRKLQNPLAVYLSKCDEIRVYENLTELKSGQFVQVPKNDQVLLLRFNRVLFYSYNWVAQSPPVENFVQYLINQFSNNSGQPIAHQTGRRKNQWFPELKHDQYTFATLAELNAFCNRMTPQFGKACMQKWWLAHTAFQPELIAPENSGQAILQTPAQHVHQQATQQAAQALYNKFGTAR